MASRKKQTSLLLNLLTSLFLLGALLLVAYFGYTFANPYHPLNPLQPPTLTPTGQAAGGVSPTPAGSNSPPAPLTVEATSPPPTSVPLPSATHTITVTPRPTETAVPIVLFTAQEGTPDYLPYSGGCTGLYVAGYVTDADDNPVMQMTIRAEGTLDGKDIFVEVLSGSNSDYTVSGWEIKLSNKLAASSGKITITLYEQGGQIPASEAVTIDTFKDCSQNLAVINFVQD